MGWDWRIGVAVMASFAAREVFVAVTASMLMLSEETLATSLSTGTYSELLSLPSILALIVFFIISMQCGTTVVLLKKEVGSWRMPIAMTISYIVLAYVAAVVVYHLTSLFL